MLQPLQQEEAAVQLPKGEMARNEKVRLHEDCVYKM
jgi:hypothetical protein